MNPLSSVPNALSSAASMVVEVAELAKGAVLRILDKLGEKLPDLPHSSKPAPKPPKPVAVVDVSEPKVTQISTSDAVVAALGKLAGPVSVAAIHTELQEMGRDEPIGHIEAALPGLAKRNLVIKHGPIMWEAAP